MAINTTKSESIIPTSLVIHNICGVFKLNIDQIDLTEISSRIANASYNVRRIPAIIIRKLNPRGTVMLFRTGKALVVGVERVDSVEKIAKRIAKDLTNILHYGKVEVHQCSITNIMAIGYVGYKIDIGKLSEDRKATKYENMSGVQYRYGEPMKKSIVHKSGKIIFCGAKTVDQVEQGYQQVKREMYKYKLPQKKQPEEEYYRDQSTFQ